MNGGEDLKLTFTFDITINETQEKIIKEINKEIDRLKRIQMKILETI